MSTLTKLKGNPNVNNSTTSDNLESNIVEFFNWGFLEAGGFFNVNIPNSGAYGGQFHRLRPVLHPGYTSGTIWAGVRKNWVWESGLEYNFQPIRISGVNVGSTFYAGSTSGNYGHYVNYPDGYVVFNSGLSLSSNVQCEYSHKWVHFSTADAPWFRQIQYDSMRPDDFQFAQYGSGMWNILAQNRVQLPAVVVEAVPRVRFEGYELGNGKQTKFQDVIFHVICNNPSDKKKLMDIITEQNEKRLLGFDKNDMRNASDFPLDYRGSIASGAKCYPDLIRLYPWEQIRLRNMTSMDIQNKPPLFIGLCRSTIEVEV